MKKKQRVKKLIMGIKIKTKRLHYLFFFPLVDKYCNDDLFILYQKKKTKYKSRKIMFKCKNSCCSEGLKRLTYVCVYIVYKYMFLLNKKTLFKIFFK